MTFKTISLLFVGILLRVSSFTPTSILSGPVGPDLSLFAVPRSVAFKYLKKCQIEQIRKDAPMHIIQELNDAREMTRSVKYSKSHYSFLVPNNSKNKNLFTIIYRMTEKFPVIYTIEAIVREPDSIETISTLQLESILSQTVVDRKGYLQIHNLGTWASGRYKNEIRMERQFVS